MIDQLIKKIQETKAPIVVGLDPMLSYVPEHIQKKSFAEFGETLEGAADAIWQFNKAIVDEVYDLIPAVKPQIAMYEQFGVEGVRVFERTVSYCQGKGLLVIGDVKRGDIGSTSAAYAAGHLGGTVVGSHVFSPFHEDFITVNPYLGSDGIKPFVDACKAQDKGLFILVKTSNPSSGEFQDRYVDGRPLYEWVGEQVARWGEECMCAGQTGAEGTDKGAGRTDEGNMGMWRTGEGQTDAGRADAGRTDKGYSEIGAVVGATYPEVGKALRKIMPRSYILVPGYGAQGGTGKDLVHYFDEDGLGAIVNSSRGIIAAYRQEAYASYGSEHFAQAARAAVEAMIADIQQALEEAG